jgi:uncharacterized DUF497 family protein
MIIIRRLIWDSWNIAHIARHDVTPDEVEEACHGDYMTSQTYKGRIRVVGPTSTGRMLAIILAPQETGTYYTVTAHTANAGERQRYQQLKGEKQ